VISFIKFLYQSPKILCFYAITLAILIIPDIYIDKDPKLQFYWQSNASILHWSLIMLFAMFVVLIMNYQLALKFEDEGFEPIQIETEASERIAKRNKYIITFIWITWSIFFFYLYKYPFNRFSKIYIADGFEWINTSTKIFISLWAISPGVIIALLTESTIDQIISERKLTDPDSNNKRINYSGYYGLICIPVFLGLLIIDYFISK